MKDRISKIFMQLGCEDEDRTLVFDNTSPGAVVLVERLVARIEALEAKVYLQGVEPSQHQDRPRKISLREARDDVPADA